MSIERLNKAASAAGFAMATPDDETPTVDHTAEKVEAPISRAVVVANTPPHLASASESIHRVTNWFKDHLPGMGGRAPA